MQGHYVPRDLGHLKGRNETGESKMGGLRRKGGGARRLRNFRIPVGLGWVFCQREGERDSGGKGGGGITKGVDFRRPKEDRKEPKKRQKEVISCSWNTSGGLVDQPPLRKGSSTRLRLKGGKKKEEPLPSTRRGDLKSGRVKDLRGVRMSLERRSPDGKKEKNKCSERIGTHTKNKKKTN